MQVILVFEREPRIKRYITRFSSATACNISPAHVIKTVVFVCFYCFLCAEWARTFLFHFVKKRENAARYCHTSYISVSQIYPLYISS